MVLFGFCIGSFLNVCIYRLPRKQSIILPASYCPQCNTSLNFTELIPIVSYLWQGGKCSYCKASISSRYMVVEIITGMLFLTCFYYAASNNFIKLLVFNSFLMIIAFIDYDHKLILDNVLIWFSITGLVINFYSGDLPLFEMLSAGMAGGIALLLIAILTKGGMGDGDIKFIAAVGLWLGLKLTILTLFLAFITGGTVSLLLLAAKRISRKDFIPFGPFIAIGAFVSALCGEVIIQWYLQSFR
ncbi:A24 family peptidase [Sporomusa aerivorans]|uniref:prepilin peptidase n=1 Tax=Sporomusa aerivorans TaxID=204936 RepID=UPI00352B6C3E